MAIFWFEMGVVAFSLLVTLLVGMHFSKDGRLSLREYMLGSRRMTVLPISLSIAATYLTGSSMVTSAQEVYMFGMQAAFSAVGYGTVGIWLSWVYLPVSYSIKSASSFEFFDRRFNNRIRKFASVIYVFETLQHTAISQLIPALALSQATGLPVFPIACLLSLICFIYTSSGGLKAVAWADGVQAIIFMTSSIVMFAVGIVLVGGPMEIWRRGVEGSRMEFWNFDLSYDVRYSVPNVLIGTMLMAPNLYLSPSFHQRVAAMPTFKQARQVAIWSTLFSGVFFSFSYSIGIVIYAYFAGCDPVLADKGIEHHQAILPYFVDQIGDKVPGMMGLLLSGIIAAGLSTTTSCWNTVACTVYEDLVKPHLKSNVSKKTSFRILNGILLLVAVISTAAIPLILKMKSIMEATVALKALSTSVYHILYNGGMFFPWVNSIGAFVGSLASGALTMYIVIGSQKAKSQNLIVDLPKILTTARCIVNGTTMEALNMTTTIGTEGYGMITEADPSVTLLHKLSFMFYVLPGLLLGITVALLVSVVTGCQKLDTVDREMIVPQMRWVLPKKVNQENSAGPTEKSELPAEMVQLPLIESID